MVGIDSFFEVDFKFVEDGLPSEYGRSPFLKDVLYGEVEQFFEGILGGESPFCLGGFSELSVEALDGICGVDEAAYLWAELEEEGQPLPVAPPVLHSVRIGGTPLFFEEP